MFKEPSNYCVTDYTTAVYKLTHIQDIKYVTANHKGMYTPVQRASLITMYNCVATTRIPQMKLIQPHSSKNNPSIFAVYVKTHSSALLLFFYGRVRRAQGDK